MPTALRTHHSALRPVDTADRLTGISHVKGGTTTIASVSYTLDDVGNRTQRVNQQGTHTYGLKTFPAAAAGQTLFLAEYLTAQALFKTCGNAFERNADLEKGGYAC